MIFMVPTKAEAFGAIFPEGISKDTMTMDVSFIKSKIQTRFSESYLQPVGGPDMVWEGKIGVGSNPSIHPRMADELHVVIGISQKLENPDEIFGNSAQSVAYLTPEEALQLAENLTEFAEYVEMQSDEY